MTASLAAELQAIATFNGLPEDDLAWLASRMRVETYTQGEILAHEGDPAEDLIVVLEGELRAGRGGSDEDSIFMITAGQVTGMLPFSRLTHYPRAIRAATSVRIALLSRNDFPEMLRRLPELQQRLVNVLADRIRETTAADQQRNKLSALGKLSAGLAHELNNPAAAARRASQTLREVVEVLRKTNIVIDQLELSREDRKLLNEIEEDNSPEHDVPPPVDALERSDREQTLADLLDARGVERSWELAAGLVDAGVNEACLSELAFRIPPAALVPVLTRLSASNTILRLLGEIENSTTRISDLVQAVKEYSYMDQAAEQEVDVHHGLESTLLMLKHRWKNAVEIVREYDRSLPPVCAKGSELNQIWTNLIDNAIDAMEGKGVLHIRTARDLDWVLVEVTDSGPGIPVSVQSRIFEPFFTTKGVGKGTGLGLDTVYRIVRNHRGDIRFASKPGETRFSVRLPLAKQPQSAKAL